MKKFYVFNLIVFLVLLITFVTGSFMVNEIRYTFAGNSWLNPVSGEIYSITGIILQVLSGIGLIIQLIFVNIKLIKDGMN